MSSSVTRREPRTAGGRSLRTLVGGAVGGGGLDGRSQEERGTWLSARDSAFLSLPDQGCPEPTVRGARQYRPELSPPSTFQQCHHRDGSEWTLLSTCSSRPSRRSWPLAGWWETESSSGLSVCPSGKTPSVSTTSVPPRWTPGIRACRRVPCATDPRADAARPSRTCRTLSFSCFTGWVS